MEFFNLIEKRGEGTFAEVWEAKSKFSKKNYAIKIVKKTCPDGSKLISNVEFQVLTKYTKKISNQNQKYSINRKFNVHNQLKMNNIYLSLASKLDHNYCVYKKDELNSPAQSFEHSTVGSPEENMHNEHNFSKKNEICLPNSSFENSIKISTLNQENVYTVILDQCKNLSSDCNNKNIFFDYLPNNVFSGSKYKFHPQIIGIYGGFYSKMNKKIVFVIELLGRSLLDEINIRKKNIMEYYNIKHSEIITRALKIFDENEIRYMLYQVLMGLRKLHHTNVFHRDIKPENILFYNESYEIPSFSSHKEWFNHAQTKTLRLKIADLGSSKIIDSERSESINSTITGVKDKNRNSTKEPYTEYIATRWYRSPECLITNGLYGPKMDVWAIGCLAAELIYGEPLFPGSSESDQLRRIHDAFGTPCIEEIETEIGKIGNHVKSRFKLPRLARVDTISSKDNNNKRLRNEKNKNDCYADSKIQFNKFPSRIAFPTREKWMSFAGNKIWQEMSYEFLDLMYNMLAYFPDQRFTIDEALEHPFFDSIKSKKKSFDEQNWELG